MTLKTYLWLLFSLRFHTLREIFHLRPFGPSFWADLKKNNEESSNAPATRKGGSAELNCAPETRELKYFQTREYLQEMAAYSIKVKF